MEQEFVGNGSQTNCDHNKLQKTEVSSADVELRDKIERSRIRLTECRNDNHVLRCNLDLIEEIMHRETEEDYQDIPESEWKKGRDIIIKLSLQIRDVQSQLRKLEEAKTPPDLQGEESARKRLNDERKAFWRMELERRQAREGVIKEMNPIAVECIEIRKKLDAEKARFRNLDRKVNLLRKEVQNKKRATKGNSNFVKSFHEMERKLSETQTEIAQLRDRVRNTYPEMKSRNDILTEENGALRRQIKSIREKRKSNSDAIKTLARKRKEIKEQFDSEKYNLEQNAAMYKEDLKQTDDNFKNMADIHDHIESLMWEKSELAHKLESLIERVLSRSREDQFSKVKSGVEYCNKATSSTDIQKKRENNDVGDSEVYEREEKPGECNPSQADKLMIECAKYRALIDAASTENERLTCLMKIQKTRLRDVMRKVIKTKRLVSEKSDQKKNLRAKFSKTIKSIKRCNKEININLRVYIREQRDENEFLRAFLKKIVDSKTQDIHLYKTFIDDSKTFLENAFQKVKDVSMVLISKRNRNSERQIS